MVFYKGAVSYKEFKDMPMSEILNLKNNAEKINKEIIREQNKVNHR